MATLFYCGQQDARHLCCYGNSVLLWTTRRPSPLLLWQLCFTVDNKTPVTSVVMATLFYCGQQDARPLCCHGNSVLLWTTRRPSPLLSWQLCFTVDNKTPVTMATLFS